ncbi:unnamed protein product [Owenia fusiformis]|uniref:Zinc finger protein GLIS2 n=1 Tax=Owenia fusiformis TaxID=6347 RepID=A0A8J1TJ05_OWEFU|nr:unnamed protein product [Owenia fusiformis]
MDGACSVEDDSIKLPLNLTTGEMADLPIELVNNSLMERDLSLGGSTVVLSVDEPINLKMEDHRVVQASSLDGQTLDAMMVTEVADVNIDSVAYTMKLEDGKLCIGAINRSESAEGDLTTEHILSSDQTFLESRLIIEEGTNIQEKTITVTSSSIVDSNPKNTPVKSTFDSNTMQAVSMATGLNLEPVTVATGLNLVNVPTTSGLNLCASAVMETPMVTQETRVSKSSEPPTSFYKLLCPNEVMHCEWESCTGTFHSLDGLVNHVNDVHVRLERADVDYKCKWTGCPRRGKGFNARYKMLIHVRTHTNEKPHKCNLCGKSFSRLENLKIHTRSHTGEKPYLCPVDGCNKAYSNSSDRFKHVRTHQVQKPYFCKLPGCNKRYTDPSSLRKHVKTQGHNYQGQDVVSYNIVQQPYPHESGPQISLPLNTARASENVGMMVHSKSNSPLEPTQPENNTVSSHSSMVTSYSPMVTSYSPMVTSYPTGVTYPMGVTSYPVGVTSYPTGVTSYPTGVTAQSSISSGQLHTEYPKAESSKHLLPQNALLSERHLGQTCSPPLEQMPSSIGLQTSTSPVAHLSTSPMPHMPSSPLSHMPPSPLSQMPSSPLAHMPSSPLSHHMPSSPEGMPLSPNSTRHYSIANPDPSAIYSQVNPSVMNTPVVNSTLLMAQGESLGLNTSSINHSMPTQVISIQGNMLHISTLASNPLLSSAVVTPGVSTGTQTENPLGPASRPGSPKDLTTEAGILEDGKCQETPLDLSTSPGHQDSSDENTRDTVFSVNMD